MNELSERRKEKRFFVQDGAFAVASPFSLLLGQIIDISTEGLSFHYIAFREYPSLGGLFLIGS